jgi:hypothetical protein
VRRAAVIPTLALALAGCSLAPAAPRSTSTNSSHEVPTPAPTQRVIAVATGPLTAIEAFATAYINWSAHTVSARMRALAALSVGQARAEVTLAAAQTGRDYELLRGGISNAGTVRAVAPVMSARNQYAVVTLERTSATNTSAYNGLKPAWHLALATVVREPNGGWVVSHWQPES